jgi:hypothetical protein
MKILLIVAQQIGAAFSKACKQLEMGRLAVPLSDFRGFHKCCSTVLTGNGMESRLPLLKRAIAL